MVKKEKLIFKKARREGKDIYCFPDIIKTNLGLSMFNKVGVFKHEPLRYSILFHVSNIKEAQYLKNLIDTLRSKDISIELESFQINAESIYCAIYTYEEKFNDAINKLAELETTFALICQSCKLNVHKCDFEERMRYIQECLMFAKSGDIEFPEKYFGVDSEWFSKFEIEKVYGINEKNTPKTFFYNIKNENMNKKYKFCFIRKYNTSNNYSKEILFTLSAMDGISYIKSSLEPVSDFAEAVRYKSTFLDSEAALSKMQRKGNGLYEKLEPKLREADTKEYSLISIFFLLEADTTEDLEGKFLSLQKELYKYGCRLDFFNGSFLHEKYIYSLPAGCNPQNNPLRIVHSCTVRFLLPVTDNLSEERNLFKENKNVNNSSDSEDYAELIF